MGGSKKYSVSLPETLAETVRKQVGPGGFSAYIAEALEQRIAMDRLAELVDDYTKDHEPFADEELDAARAALRHDRRGSTGSAV